MPLFLLDPSRNLERNSFSGWQGQVSHQPPCAGFNCEKTGVRWKSQVSDEAMIREWASVLGINLGRSSVGFVYMGGARNFAYE